MLNAKRVSSSHQARKNLRMISAIFLSLMCFSAEASVMASDTFTRWQGSTQSENQMRGCKPGSDDALGKKKSSPTKSKNKSQVPSVEPVCLEVKQSVLEVQEYFQKVVRDLRWTVIDEQATEDFWNFSIHVDAEELAAYTKPAPELRISWTGGKASVNVQMIERPDGYTRVLVSARFDGYGEQQDSFAPKRESWPLPSNGALERKLSAIAKEHFTAGH